MALKNPILSNPIAADIPKLNEILDALSKANPTDVDGISTGAVRLYEASSGKWQWQLYNGTNWAPVPFLQHNVDQLDGYRAAITPAADTVAVRNASGLLQDSITGNAATASSAATLSETLPVNKGGTGATTSEQARTNLGVPPTSHTSTATTYGVGNATQYGHLKLSDATDSASGVSGGVAATPAAAKVAKDAADAAMEKASTPASGSNLGPVKVGSGITIAPDGTISIDPWNIFPMRVPIAVDGVTFGGSDGRRAIMPGETVARENWIICDGGSDGNGGSVPNLLGRMILGASDAYPAGSWGGYETHRHSLSGTVGATTLTVEQMPWHIHRYGDLATPSYGYAIDPTGRNTMSLGAEPLDTSAAGGSQSHTHELNGTSAPAGNLPPYYALSFIMRIA